MSREKFQVFQSQAYSKFVILSSDPVPSAGAQVSYNVPREIFDKLVNYNILIKTDSNSQGDDYELDSSYTFLLSDEVIQLIGSDYRNINNRFFIRVASSNGKPQLIKAAYKHKNSQEYNWFVELYDRNGIGSYIVFEFDQLNKTFKVDLEKNFETQIIPNEFSVEQTELDNLISTLKNMSKKYYEYYSNDNKVYEDLNKISKEDIDTLLDTRYNFDHCVNSDLSNKPANTLRHVILQKLKKSEIFDESSFNDIKKSIIDANSKKLEKYLSKPFNEWSIVKTTSDPFATNWRKIFRVTYPFFYYLSDEQIVDDFILKIRTRLIDDLCLINVDTEKWGIDGINSSGAHDVFIAFYPTILKDARCAYQMYINFENGNCYVGMAKGSKCDKNYDISTIQRIECNNYDEISKAFFELLSIFIESNNLKPDEIINKNLSNNSEFPARTKRTNKNDLNIILYGAPGTGKTYMAPIYALASIENKKVEDYINISRQKILNRYNQYIDKGQIVFTTFHQSYGYEEFIQGLRPDENSDELKFVLKDGVFKNIAKKALYDLENRYVIIIDEINRGNISKIFGELITLIEENKRWGEEEQMKVALPSGELFTVPNNLFIIGTMNSADKSISVVDAALRRRFSFIEKCPDSSTLSSEYKNFLNTINDNLYSDLNTKDLLIGHSFFVEKPLESSADIINQKIVPLLYEYYFNNEDKVKSLMDRSIDSLKFTNENGEHFKLREKNNPYGRVCYELIKETKQ